jgi:hypothetical protein
MVYQSPTGIVPKIEIRIVLKQRSNNFDVAVSCCKLKWRSVMTILTIYVRAMVK